jgi:AcrR family transcriptional regulator
VPRLWTQSVEAHRAAVRDAILDATAALVAEHGLASVAMSRIATETGIGRATLYKYFPDVEAILRAWHERHVTRHLDHLAAVADQHAADPVGRLEAVLEAYARIVRETRRNGGDLAAVLHHDEHVARADGALTDLVTGLVAQAARAATVRGDVPPAELAAYCLHALGAAADLPSEAAVRRLVHLILDGLRPA